MTSARFCACGNPAKVIFVPWAKCCGLSSQSLSFSASQVWPLWCLQRVGKGIAVAAFGDRSADHVPQIRADLVRSALVEGMAHCADPRQFLPFLRIRLGQQRRDRLELRRAPARLGAVAAGAVPATTKTGFSKRVGRISSSANSPATIATISAVSTEAMTLFHSNAGIGDLSDRVGQRRTRVSPRRTK